jgi:hypothetical protein
MRAEALLFLVAALYPTFDVARATTWHVELDGSGDFTHPQDAVDAAAEGDTIRIGPGQFDQFRPPGGWSSSILDITKDNLTIIGAGRDETILGPTEYYAVSQPRVVNCWRRRNCKISQVKIVNTYLGVIVEDANVEVSQSRFANCGFGIDAIAADDLHVCDVEFTDIRPPGDGLYVSGTFLIEHCRFDGDFSGVQTSRGVGTIADCEYLGHRALAAVLGQSDVHVLRCDSGNEAGIGLEAGESAEVMIEDCLMRGSYFAVLASTHSIVRGENCVLAGGTTGATIRAEYGAQVEFQRCDIQKSGSWAVKLFYFNGQPVEQRLIDCYWGTSDPDSVTAWIWDGHDDPAIHSTVTSLPMANGSVPTETRPWGDVKALFR